MLELEIIYSSHQCNLSLVLRRAQSSANGKFRDCLSALNVSVNLDVNQYPSGPKPGLAFVCLFVLIIYIPSTIFQLNRDVSSWVEPVLS